MRLDVNGETRQQTFCEDLSYKPWETLTELSALQDLGPGDLVVTGTPGGTAAKAPGKMKMFIARLLPDAKRWPMFIKGAMKDPDYLKDGDRIHAVAKTADGSIDLGEHNNTIVRQAS